MAKHLHQLDAQRAKLEGLARGGLSQNGTRSTLPEEKAQTRHSELETTEVLLIRAYQFEPQKHGTWVTLLNHEKLFVPQNGRSLPPSKWREISATLMQNTLKVAEYLAPNAVSKSQLNWLADYFYLGRPEYGESAMLRVALAGDDESLTGLDGAKVNDKYRLSYNQRLGYLATKRG